MAAAVALAQTERAEKFISLRRKMGLVYTKHFVDQNFLSLKKFFQVIIIHIIHSLRNI